MRLGESGLAAGERLESIERGGGLAALQKSHSREEIDVALPLGREGKDLEAARARVEDLVGERLALRSGYLKEQAVRSSRVERPAVAHRRAGRSAGEEPEGRRRVADRIVAGTVGLGRNVLCPAAPRRLRIVLVAALAHCLEPFARGIATGCRRRLPRQREGRDLDLHSGGDARVAVVGDLPATRPGGKLVRDAVQGVLDLDGAIGGRRRGAFGRFPSGAGGDDGEQGQSLLH